LLLTSDFGTCVPAGTLAKGDRCSLTTQSEYCEAGTLCTSAAGSRACASMCDLSNRLGCNGDVCAPRTAAVGVCLQPIGGRVYQSCSSIGSPCEEMSVCAQDPRLGGKGENVCVPYCRTAQGDKDCQNVLVDGSATTCNPYLAPGIQALGVCTPPCSRDGDCTVPGSACDRAAGVCRMTCTTDRQCAESLSSTGWICRDGFCA
jgi:hypothetical protein